jgi:hypothetical protein
MEIELKVQNQNNMFLNYLNLSHVNIQTIKTKMLIILELIVVNSLMFKKDKLKIKPMFYNGTSMEIKIKFG